MHITQSLVYSAPLAQVSAVYSDPDYLLHRLHRRGITDPHVDITEADGATSIDATLAGDTSLLPPAARRFIKSGITAVITAVLKPASAGVRHGHVDVTVSGAPVSASATVVLTDQGENTKATVDLDFSVSIPLVGRTVEQKAVGNLQEALAFEPQAVREWLDAHPEL